MKRYYLIFGSILASALAVVNCTKEINDPTQNEGGDNIEVEEGVPFQIVASSSDTKTTISGYKTSWAAEDAINLYHAEAGSTSYVSDGEFKIAAEDLDSQTFKGTLASALVPSKSYDWYAIYPYTYYAETPATRNSGSVIIGSAYDGSQSQTGNNSTSHLCSTACPLWGVAKGVSSSDVPTLNMHHLSSVLEIEVKNQTGSNLVVENVSFTAPDGEKIAGKFYVDITGETPVYTAKEAESSNVASLTVSSGEAIANGASAKFYLAVKPFTASAGETLSISVNGHEKQLVLKEDFSFNAGKVEKLKFTANWDPVNDLLTKMLNLGFGSKVIRVYGDGGAGSKFIAHYYVDIAKSTIHFTTFDFDNSKVTRYEPTLTANANTLTFDTPVILPGKEYDLGSIEISSTEASFPDMTDLGDLGTGTQLTDNWCWGQYDQLKTVKDYFTSDPYYWYQDENSEWKYNYYQWHFKNTKPTVSSDFTEEAKHPYYGLEWNGVYQTFAANFSYEYVAETDKNDWVHYNLKYRASSPEGNLPIVGTDVLKFDSAAGMADVGLGSVVATQDRFRSRFPNISTFLLDQYHVIVRDTEARDAGMIIMSTTSDSFIYWPQAVN